MEDKTILRLVNVSKNYKGVKALDNINIDFQDSEVHAIVGENGAGKSSLIKLISGAIKPSSGKIVYKGQNLENLSPREIIDLGISVVYQELNTVNNLKVYQNIFYGAEKSKGIFLDEDYMKIKSKEILTSMGVDIGLDEDVKDIGIGNQQLIEIAHSLVYDIDVLILDEPTASLTKKESQLLFSVLESLKKKGVLIIYISHRLDEVLSIADRISILRDGIHIATEDNNISENKLIDYMVGRSIENSYPYTKRELGKTILELENLSSPYVKNINLSLREGEILGLSGLVYSGRTELSRAIIGLDKKTSGQIRIRDRLVNIDSPKDAIDNKISYITEDRKNLGLILNMSLKNNSSYSILDDLSSFGIIDKNREYKKSKTILDYLRTKYEKITDPVNSLSGGNQQKVLISKSLVTNSDILIFDEPTRGVDIGAKQEIYRIIMDLAVSGKSIILISSEMPEVIGLSDRVLVMSKGKIVSEYSREDVTQEKIFRDSASLLKERDYV